MKVTTQLAVVICVGILTACALVFGLAVFAGWSDAAIVALIAAAGGGAGTLLVQLRAHRQTAEKLTAQDGKLDRVVEQTNGKSDAEVRRIALEALAEAKRQGLL